MEGTSDLVDAIDITLAAGQASAAIGVINIAINSADYDMKHRNRGKCLVLNHEKFDQNTGCEPREGTKEDVDRIVRCFQRLQFVVEVVKDGTLQTIETKMQQVCNEDHSDSDCVVVVVLTHGDGHNLWAKNVKYPTETLFEYFNGNRCPTLIGKPKIFIIQACRGGKVDPGSTLRALGPTPAFTSAPTTPQRIYTIPTNADFLVYYSTSPGHYSFRNPVTGSYFIDNLVYILNNCCYNGNYQYNHDLVTLFTLVNQLVAIKFESHNSKRPEIHGKKQMPHISSMLTRLIYFRPKP